VFLPGETYSEVLPAIAHEEDEAVGNNLATPFVLLVDPEMVKKKEDFRMVKKNDYKYYMIGRNHSTCAKMDPAKSNPHYAPYKKV
jgi:hypothetical protein